MRTLICRANLLGAYLPVIFREHQRSGPDR
jgi:hypothetical protein